MKIDTYFKLQRESFPDVPEAFEGVFDHINRWLEQLVSALQHKLTFEDNFNGVVKELTVKDNTPTDFQVKGIRGKPRGVVLLDRETSDYHLASLQILDNDTIRVKLYFPTTAPTGDTKIRVLVLGS